MTAFLTRRLKRLGRRLRWQFSYASFLKDLQTDPDPAFGAAIKARGIALVHIPKTGGTSLGTALYGRAIGHRRWDQIRDIDPGNFERWLKLAVVREPVDRFVSAYDYLAAGGNNEFDRFFSRRFVTTDVNRFAARLLDSRYRARVMQFWHFRPQTDFVVSAEGRIMVDRLIPFDAVSAAAAELGVENLPRLNATRGKRTRRDALSGSTIRAVNDIYAADRALYQLALAGTEPYGLKLETP